LGGGIWGLSRSSNKGDGFFDLVKEGFNWLIRIIRLAETGVVALEVSWSEPAVGRLQVRELFESGGGCKTSDAVAERFQIHGVHGGNDLLFSRFVCGNVFFEEVDFGLVFLEEGGKLAVCGCVWNRCGGTWVFWAK
jgi:hypothetical protein